MTACSQIALNRIADWKLDPDFVTTSDHRAVTFTLNTELKDLEALERKTTRLFNTAKADWQKFRHAITDGFLMAGFDETSVNEAESKECIEEMVEELGKLMSEACTGSMPKIGTAKARKGLTWWNEELENTKREVIRRRRRIRHANPRRKPFVLEEYLQSLAEYKEAILHTKTQSWKEYCTGQTRETMWDKIYRILRAANKRTDEQMLKNKTGETLDPQGSADLLAETFYPHDYPATDNIYNRKVREEVESWEPGLCAVKQVHGFVPFRLYEMQTVVDNIDPSKAPGKDGFTSDICRMTIKAAPQVILAIMNKCLRLGCFPKVWKSATIRILRKPGREDYSVPKGYRPICLLPVMGKVLEKMVNNIIM